MKSVNQIISHIISKPQYKKIAQKKCFDKVVKLLPPHLKNAVLFTYTKNKVLFFVLNHPGLKMEFHYKVSFLKNLLKQVKSLDPNCHDMQDISDIKFFVSNKPNKREKPQKKFIYKELSSGEFKILTKNKKLQKLFSQIKDAITTN